MREAKPVAKTVRIVHTRSKENPKPDVFRVTDLPPRSRLYSIEPIAPESVWQESLSSYLNRLANRHHVPPRALATQEIVPHLSNDYFQRQFGTVSRTTATGINGNGELAREWSAILEQLTGRSDVCRLTTRWWLGDLTSGKYLRKKPAWCPVCYSEWRNQAGPIYQPLLWMFHTVILCPKHLTLLCDQCPHCQKHQSVIALKTPPGHCTQCQAWLGSTSDEVVEQETVHWQQWIIHALEELRMECLTSGPLSWEPFFTHLAICMREPGAAQKLSNLSTMSQTLFYIWTGRTNKNYVPTLKAIFDFCYLCNVTPFQVMTSPHALLAVIQNEPLSLRRRHYAQIRRSVDRARCLERMQAILDGHAEPIGIERLAKELGHSGRDLHFHFPQESALITKLASDYRKQRRKLREQRVCEEVRQAVITLHAQEVYPSHQRVATLLSQPTSMRLQEAKDALRAARSEFGVEPRKR